MTLVGKDGVLITNIQRMCFHDGPGIRTTVFLKGCNLHCPWCANPENISASPQEYELDGRKGVYGNLYSCEELFAEVMKDYEYYSPDGGVTFSGGEPLLQIAKLIQLLSELKKHGISTAVETALQVPLAIWQDAADLIDHYIVDLKILDIEQCRSIIGGDVNCYESCFAFLEERDADITLRIPLNHEYTMREENIDLLDDFLKRHSDIPVEIFATHDLGSRKYESLSMKLPVFRKVSDDDIAVVSKRFDRDGLKVSINKF